MKSLVCCKLIDKYIIANRFDKVGVIIDKEKYDELLNLSLLNGIFPLWLIPIFNKMDIDYEKSGKLNDYLIIKELGDYNYSRVSYEITEQCNYDCEHCYLGKKTANVLNRSDKENIINIIKKSGCLWLQLTGGEPLIDKDFPYIYSLAHSFGMLISISTNGSMLSSDKIANLFINKKPYRLTISVYGATKESYERLTNGKGSFDKFMKGLNFAKLANIKTRLNIIVTKYNENEIDQMTNIAKSYGFEYFVYYSMTPTLSGNQKPISLETKDCNSRRKNAKTNNGIYIPCQAGETSFHVNSSGEASICKSAREPRIDLLNIDDSIFIKLSQISKTLLTKTSECSVCSLRKKCPTCPLIYDFYKKSGCQLQSICNK